ncbi:sulfatase-like hydrolase/transferase [Wenyingzhuangia sp. 2_MG-2023]|uniref:sulfatase-like hydrolase/transferase n=1 Tax=Wenyingzhuangia sp. 2_MG-2023 TaxID=3062639 RepID=UPI0026E45DEF|nr:sulfatase-like hydrolase/transferase [Wenyingzhuangia sp. 2_MG-2023]MDO6738978.1 sulfatase-like hydrolase/transferase [Wenyingzhuangia sp. 2_MG-2023]
MFIKQILFISLSLALASCGGKDNKKKEQKEKPNIVFIFTDDQTYTSIHALGNNEIITPNMDKLVHNGTTLTHTYNMGSWSGAVCLASRAMMNTGRSVWNAEKFTHKINKEDNPNKTWSKLLQSGGYETYMTGKWHVHVNAEKVFNHTAHVRGGMPKDNWDHFKMVTKFDSISKIKGANPDDIMPIGYNRPQNENDHSWDPTDPKFGGFWQGGKHWSDVVKDDALSFIDQAKSSEKPFFMYLAFNAPHDPRQAPQEYQDLYDVNKISVPKSYLPEYPFRKSIGNGNNLRDEALAPFPRTEYAIKTHTKEYYASITYADKQIGLILDALKKSGKMDNTYIIFTADHGLAMGRHGLLGKQNLFDHSMRPPMVIVGPEIPKNKKVDTDVYLQDAMATALDIAGVEKPTYIDFNSFLNIAKGKETKSYYPAIYGAYLDVQRAIRKNGYKLLVYPEIKKVLLFDLNNDPEEMHDIATKPEQKERVQKLFKDLLQLQKDMNDPLDISAIYQQL